MTADFDFDGISDLYETLGRGGQRGVRPRADAGDRQAGGRRRIVIVLLDVSASMAFPVAGVPGADESQESRPAGWPFRSSYKRPARPRRRIDVLNERLREWLPQIRAAGRTNLRQVEIAVITFGGRGVVPVTGNSSGPADTWPGDDGVFVPLAGLDLGDLTAFGTTPLAEAINKTLDLADARVRHLAGQDVTAGPVRVVMFADGGSYDRRLSADSWRPAAARIAALRRQKRVEFFVFGVPGADELTLRAIAGEGYAPLLESGFGNLLDLLLQTTTVDDPLEAIRDRFGWGTSAESAGGSRREQAE